MKQYKQLRKKDYEQICSMLSIDPKTDLLATHVLHSKVSCLIVRKTFRKLKSTIKHKIVLLFSPGPSLESSIEQLLTLVKNFRREVVIVAVDGATKALLKFGIDIDVIITDLDGSIEAIRESLENGSIVVVHAHGDNIPRLNEITDIISKEGIIGTTQTKETFKVKNLGGFTDGDRAAY
ncbi:MAG: 6-hydroxymethylpterin diphosphokinase MptE-like protein, partial [Candidatus Heimdallarchaeota archaeon]